jgi:predicted  nucleic acid-binding Zn-ribbon protein
MTEGEKETEPTTPIQTSDISEARRLLGDLKGKQTAFEEFVASATTAIQTEIAKAKAILAEVGTFKEIAEAAKNAAETGQTVVEQVVSKASGQGAEVEALKTSIATIKGAMEEKQTSASADLGIITQTKSEIETLKTTAGAVSDKLSKEHEEIAAHIAELQTQQTSLQTVLKDISDIKSAAEGNGTAVKNFLDEVGQTKERFATLNTDTGTQYDSLIKKQDALQAKISEIEDANTKINDLRRKLFENTDDTKSVQNEIDDLRTQIRTILTGATTDRDTSAAELTAFLEKANRDQEASTISLNKKFDALHESLKGEILALLPSAGAAGLASTYYDAKSRYAPTSYAGKPGSSTLTGWKKVVRGLVGNNPASVVATIFFYGMFLVPLGALAYGTYDLVWQLEHNPQFRFDYRILALRFLIAVPLATISGFGFASLQQYRKLYEQYNHKQRVMELYRSFRDEIATNGDAEQTKALLKIMLDSVADKAWESPKEGGESTKGDDAISMLDRFASVAAKIKSLGA